MKIKWDHLTFVRLLFPLVLGIVFALFYTHFIPFCLPIIVVGVVALVALNFSKSTLFQIRFSALGSVLTYAILFLLGNWITISCTPHLQEKHFNKHQQADYVLVQINEPPIERKKSYKAEVKFVAATDSELEEIEGKAIVYFAKDSLPNELEYGDLLLLKNKFKPISPPLNPMQFDYRQYLYHRGIYHQAYLKQQDWEVLDTNCADFFWGNVYRLRMHLLEVLKTNLKDKNELGVASALLLGYRHYLENDLMEVYTNVGAMHVLAVSGLHVGIIYLIISSLVSFLNRWSRTKWVKLLLILCVIWLFAFTTGLSPSVTRAATMFSFIAFGQVALRHVNIYNILAASAFFILLFDPYMITQAGFLLSYAALIGIIYFQPKIYGLFSPQYRAIDWAWKLSTVSIAAQLGTLPLTLFYFQQFPIYFILSNLIVIPAATFILCLGLGLFAAHTLSLLLSPVYFVTKGIAYFLAKLIASVNSILFWIQELPGAVWQGLSIHSLEIFFIYSVTFLLTGFFIYKSPRFIKLGLGILIIWLALDAYAGFKENQQRQLLVYHLTGQSTIGLVQGNEVYLLATQEAISNSNYQFSVQNHMKKAKLTVKEVIDWRKDSSSLTTIRPFLLRNQFIQQNDQRLLILSEALPQYQAETKLDLNSILLVNDAKISIEELSRNFDFEQLIIDGSNKPWTALAWIEDCRKMNLDFHYTKTNGAFVLNL